jgi:hypothetical protein
MADVVPAELQRAVLARIDDDEVVRLACELIKIPSFTTEETRCAECCLYGPGVCTRVLALTALEAAL